ncbi:MAG: hypothetical protein IT378_27800, partial [Sandaracinaceae bacterium]|nr:hypothetical protein [Sandaracinaceae bacterium]
WIPIVDDPFVASYPNAPPAFYQTFVRADPERTFTRVYVTLWDPRQVQLRIQAGTREPESSTGQRGAGTIPRDEPTLRHLVGAFNGGFQALHGEFGMMAEGRVYLPPKPWAATVAVFDDGRVGMGSWPAPDWQGRFYDERLANRQIPEDMVDMRQNLTSVVEDAEWNPWRRWWWGAAPREADEQTFTTRSGLCLTSEGFFAYFWGNGLGPEALGAAMSSARCARGIHLDMNSAHCGFELFRTIPPGEEAAPRERRRSESEPEGPLPEARGWRVRARRAVRSMARAFPRYTGHDGRDFFYLTLRPVLPGPALSGATEGEGTFSTRGLPHAGWPHAFARTSLGREDARTWVVRIDPRRAVPAPLQRDERRPLAFLTMPPTQGSLALVARRSSIGWTFAIGEARAGDRVIVAGGPVTAESVAARGVDRDGFLVYVEREAGAGPISDALERAGAAGGVELGESRLAFAVGDEGVGPDGFVPREVTPSSSMAWLARDRPASEVLWPDNEPRPYSEWGYLQGQRVRYFPEGPPRFARPPGAGE